eukprot:1870075-Alexandrium_andersonii.AAC.1
MAKCGCQGASMRQKLSRVRKVAPSVEHVLAGPDGAFTLHVDPWSLIVVSLPRQEQLTYT